MTMPNPNTLDDAQTGRILVVDDDPMISGMLAITLKGAKHHVEEVYSGEDALMLLSNVDTDNAFDVVILDIEMGESLNGYETCRRFREMECSKDIPVIFLSAHEGLDDRLKAYDAGGDDFMGKPFDISEVLRKTAIAVLHRKRRTEIAREGENSVQVAMMTITALGESGVAMAFARDALQCTTLRALARLTIRTFASLGLSAQVQIRGMKQTLTKTKNGPASPLEESVFSQMHTMERIFCFKNRMIVNQDEISILILDMPLDDAERCGRIRDHAAMIAETAVRMLGLIELRTEMIGKASEIQELSELNRGALEHLRTSFQQLQHGTFLHLEQISAQLEAMYVHLGLTYEQEHTISDAVRGSTDNVRLLFETALSFDQEFSRIIDGLSKAAKFNLPTADTAADDDTNPSANIELW
jgi:DNA-binding response OmpR family regulator